VSQVKQSLIIAHYTFKEMLKSKILWNVAILGLLISIATMVATEFTFGVPSRVALDLGLGSLSVSSYVIAILIGMNLIKKEEESRTIYMIVSRPVQRVSFLIGKVIGVSGFLALNLILLSLVSAMVVILLGGQIDQLVVVSMVFSILEAILLLCVVVLFSLISNSAITLMASVLVLVAGHAISETTQILYVTARPWLKFVIDGFSYILPSFHRFNLKDLVLYQQNVEMQQIILVMSYWAFYTTGLICFSSWILNKKNLD
jgi:ABC-type transport system involved in multi-copper enzyme maturation permease subunit